MANLLKVLTGDAMEKMILTTFTDPMMGLSYEQEPVYEKLATHFGDRLVFHYVMSGLVRDVSDFMMPEERALPAEEGIRLYNRRLAPKFIKVKKPSAAFRSIWTASTSSTPTTVPPTPFASPTKQPSFAVPKRLGLSLEASPGHHRRDTADDEDRRTYRRSSRSRLRPGTVPDLL